MYFTAGALGKKLLARSLAFIADTLAIPIIIMHTLKMLFEKTLCSFSGMRSQFEIWNSCQLMQGVPGGKVNTLGGHSIGHSK